MAGCIWSRRTEGCFSGQLGNLGARTHSCPQIRRRMPIKLVSKLLTSCHGFISSGRIESIPEDLQGSLPSIEQIEAELSDHGEVK